MDFFLPIARWRGYGGSTNVREWSFETFTWAAGLASITERIALFMTVHVPLLHPLYAAKALATVDHISHGRAGLNIVCGWNPDEFDMFGVTLVKDAYVQAKEWIDVIVKTYNSDMPIDFNGKYYKLKGCGQPSGLGAEAAAGDNECGLRPARAATSPRRIAITCSRASPISRSARDTSPTSRAAPRNSIATSACSPSAMWCAGRRKAEAEDYYDYYSRQNIDEEAVDYHMQQKKNFSHSHEDEAFKQYKQRFSAGTGSYPLVGTPEKVASELAKFAGAGFNGAALSFVNYKNELAVFLRDGDAADEASGLAHMSARA